MPRVEHQHRGGGLQPGHRHLDRLAAPERGQRRPHHLRDRPTEDRRVGEGAVHQLAILRRAHHLGQDQGWFRLHDRHL